jgi:transcriptional antiterminator
MKLLIPEQMKKISIYFDLALYKAPYDIKEMMKRAASYSDKNDRQIIIDFIDEWLSKNYTELEMKENWNRLGTGVYLEKEGGVKYFLTEFRKYLI